MDYNKIITDRYGVPVEFLLDNKVHRFGKKKEVWCVGKEWKFQGKDYWVVHYGNFKLPDENNLIKSWENDDLTITERRKLAEHINQIQTKAKNDKRELHKKTADEYQDIFGGLKSSHVVHDYLKAKGISEPHGTFIVEEDQPSRHLYKGTLLVPIYNNKKKICGSQRIFKKDSSYQKIYSQGLELIGSYFPFGEWENADIIYLAEGFATAATIYEILKVPTIACFQATNIPETIETIRKYNPESKIVICTDKDADQKGEIYALKAYKKYHETIIRVVKFPSGHPDSWSDFNDLAQFVSIDAVEEQLKIEPDKFEDEQFRKDIDAGFTFKDEENDRTIYDYERLLQFYYLKTKYFYIGETGMVYNYIHNHYRPVDDATVMAFAEDYFNPKPKNVHRREFLAKVKANNLEDVNVLKIKDEPLINFNNCVLNYETNQILKNSPKFRFTYSIPHDYNQDATCPTWDQLLLNVFEDNPDLVRQMNEFLGFIISGMSYEDHQKLAVFYGEGENGKSTLLNIITELIGGSNYSSIEMASINQRFGTAPLEFSLLNTCEEEPKTSFRKSGPVKKLTGNSAMPIEHKGKPSYSFTNRAKIICTFNELPEFLDSSHGMYRRFLLFLFGVNFKKNPEKKIKNIYKKIELEYSGIVNRALEGLKRIRDNGDFTDSIEHNKLLSEIKRDSDPIHDFVCQMVRKSEGDFVVNANIYTAFKNFFGESDYKYSERYFFKKFKKEAEVLGVKQSQKKIGNKNFRGFVNLRINEVE